MIHRDSKNIEQNLLCTRKEWKYSNPLEQETIMAFSSVFPIDVVLDNYD